MNFDEWQLHPVKCRQSAAATALNCERKWFLQYRAGVRLRGGYLTEAADLGKIYHKFQLEGPGPEAEQRVADWVRSVQVEIVKQIEAGEDMDGTLARKANKLTELFKIARAMAQVFWERFPMPDNFVELAKEVQVEMNLPEPWPDVVLSGTIDKLLLNTTSGDVWIRDHKSTGQKLDAIFTGAGWRLQGRIYRLLAEHWLRNDFCVPEAVVQQCSVPISMTPRGFILDGIERPGIKLCRTDEKNAKEWNCSVEEAYLRRVKEWYKMYEGKEDEAPMRSRAAIYTEGLYPLELQSVFDKFQQYARCNEHDPRAYHRDVTGSECYKYNRKCKYADLCDTNPKNWDDLFERKFKLATPEETEDEF